MQQRGKIPHKMLPNLLTLGMLTLGSMTMPVMAEDAKKVNANINYILDGQMVSGWGIYLGDPDNWSSSAKNRIGESATGKVDVMLSDFKSKGDAIKITWAPRKNVKGVFSIYGTPIDLSSFENTGALVIDMKVDVMPDKAVTIGMDCGYPCRGELNVRKNISDNPKGEWQTLPIPLNCLTKAGTDLKKVNGPFVLSTEGKLTVTIANVRLQKLAEGDKGCAEQK